MALLVYCSKCQAGECLPDGSNCSELQRLRGRRRMRQMGHPVVLGGTACPCKHTDEERTANRARQEAGLNEFFNRPKAGE